MVRSRSRGQATTCGQWALYPAGRLAKSAWAVSSLFSETAAGLSSSPEPKGLENLGTEQPDTKSGMAMKPRKAHRHSRNCASVRLTCPVLGLTCRAYPLDMPLDLAIALKYRGLPGLNFRAPN